MSVLQNLPESLHGPLRSFAKELEGHIEFFTKIISESVSSEAEVEVTRRKIEGRFHLIKGGSGFFKLDNLRELATSGEDDFKKIAGDNKAIQLLIREKIPKILKLIKAEYVKINFELNNS